MSRSSLNRVFLGFDPREYEAYDICRHSLMRHTKTGLYVYPLRLRALTASGLMYRERDPLQSTDFTYSRFLTPFFGGRAGWALFMDCDILVRGDIDELFRYADPEKAVMVVKHEHRPNEDRKMGNATQTVYRRKNWSSVMLFNCAHPKNIAVNWVQAANEWPASKLHQFGWLDDDDIGSLPVRFNYLVGYNTKDQEPDPLIVHFTSGIPGIHPGCDEVEYADEWFREKEMFEVGE
jgi:hypothetical protein